jgi:hypothetical protein
MNKVKFVRCVLETCAFQRNLTVVEMKIGCDVAYISA